MVRFDTGSLILEQGAAVAGMYLILQGGADVTCANAEGQIVLLHVMGPGEVFGETEALSGLPAVANCHATQPTTLLLCPTTSVRMALSNPVFTRNLWRASYDRLAYSNRIKFVDQFYSVEQRLRDYLYRMSIEGPQISRTQAELAGFLGAARQTVNRELGRLRDKEILELTKGSIRILDRAALRENAAT
ncbi:Crp/Fnr family transcriptional regulator [Candidatus Rhodobacter oscarellae]|uniref:Crp/Fnr family transcriptional regulator n=1 Tax=Candidatus Rhodobacter oscarellae TaxID=1675527 RepID=UPI001364BACE|nr:Crp/Fnr family transcriptional regulator [Candidatus Rhodobacter lobularis]